MIHLNGGIDGKPNDRLFVNKYIYRFTVPKRGDIVVFKSPTKMTKNTLNAVLGYQETL